MAQGVSFSVACGIFPDQELNPRPLYWQVDSYPLCQQWVPIFHISEGWEIQGHGIRRFSVWWEPAVTSHGRRDKLTFWSLFIRALFCSQNLVTSQSFHFLISSSWWLGFNHVSLVGWRAKPGSTEVVLMYTDFKVWVQIKGVLRLNEFGKWRRFLDKVWLIWK